MLDVPCCSLSPACFGNALRDRLKSYLGEVAAAWEHVWGPWLERLSQFPNSFLNYIKFGIDMSKDMSTDMYLDML